MFAHQVFQAEDPCELPRMLVLLPQIFHMKTAMNLESSKPVSYMVHRMLVSFYKMLETWRTYTDYSSVTSLPAST